MHSKLDLMKIKSESKYIQSSINLFYSNLNILIADVETGGNTMLLLLFHSILVPHFLVTIVSSHPTGTP